MQKSLHQTAIYPKSVVGPGTNVDYNCLKLLIFNRAWIKVNDSTVANRHAYFFVYRS
jgi:hypothetical protein